MKQLLTQGKSEVKIKGKITSWNEGKGFGFITPNEGDKQIFVHIKAFNNRKKIPAINQVVTFTLSTDKQGRACAEKVTRAGEVLSKKTKKGSSSFAVFVPIIFAVFVGVSALTNNIEFLIFPFYLAISLFTFILYAVDKSAAKKGAWRTQESTLHLFSFSIRKVETFAFQANRFISNVIMIKWIIVTAVIQFTISNTILFGSQNTDTRYCRVILACG